jgi:hypothetical protein
VRCTGVRVHAPVHGPRPAVSRHHKARLQVNRYAAQHRAAGLLTGRPVHCATPHSSTPIAAGVLFTLATLLGACTSTTQCWAGELALSPTSEKNAAGWQLVRVNPDGSVAARHAGAECVLPPPVTGASGAPVVIASSYEAQTATIRVRWCTTSQRWGWSP